MLASSKNKPKRARSKAPKKTTKNVVRSKEQINDASSESRFDRWWRLVFKILGLLIWTASAVIVAQLVVGYLMLWFLGRETFAQPVPTAIYSALSYVLALVWLIFATPKIVAKLKRVHEHKNKEKSTGAKSSIRSVDREVLGLRGLPTWTDTGLAPVGFIVSTLLSAGLVAIFNNFPWFDAGQAQEVGFSVYSVGFDRIVAFAILVVAAPIAEELIFRGWLYGKLRLMLSEKISDVASMAISIFLVSLLFGIVHLQWNVGVTVFAMSVVLCGLREITGTVYAGILMHMINNGVAFFLLYVLGRG